MRAQAKRGPKFLCALLLLACCVVFVACRSDGGKSSTSELKPETIGVAGGSTASPPAGPSGSEPAVPVAKPSGPPLSLVVAYGSEKKAWFEEAARQFEASGARTASGKGIRVEGKAMGSGEAMLAILSGELKPHVFCPASGAYMTLLNRSWLSQAGHTAPLTSAGEPIVLSPVVIAMWKPMAEALGWPNKSLGWKDLIEVSRKKGGWADRGHPEWGSFKFGHTHPELSNSGLLSFLAEAYAGARKTRGLSPADLDKKATRDFVTSVESSIVHYGKSTGFFGEKMLSRGPSYLSAAVLYENLVIESYATPHEGAVFPLVAIYPVEGTFWSDHPYATLDAPWVDAEARDAAQKFLAFLKDKPRQTRALELGFRPADPAIAIGAPIDAAHGADAKQPQTLLEVPDGATLEALLGLFRDNKKAADIELVFDKSGSMVGTPLAEAKAGAKAFLDALGPRDQVSLLFFDSEIYPPVGPLVLGKNQAELRARVDGLIAGGGTSLYEAVARAYADATQRAKSDPGRIHAVVVMTDGKDENSHLLLSELMRKVTVEGGEAPVKIFTIAYGSQAEAKVLDSIAETAQGSSAKGSVDTIVQVYREMASFF